MHKHSFAGNGRAMILGDTDGLVKVVAARGGPILGFHLAGPWASELLHEGYLAVNWEALPSDVGALIHAHPSLSEAIGETMIPSPADRCTAETAQEALEMSDETGSWHCPNWANPSPKA